MKYSIRKIWISPQDFVSLYVRNDSINHKERKEKDHGNKD